MLPIPSRAVKDPTSPVVCRSSPTCASIEAAIESELAAAIDAEIAYAVSLGIEEAAVAAGWQAYFDVLTSGGTDAQASAAAYEACGSSCDGY